MAIFKKLLVSENPTPNRKVSNNTIFPSSIRTSTDQTIQQQPQEGSTTSFSSSLNERSLDNTDQIPNDLENFCWHIYNRPLKRSDIRLIVFSEKDIRLLYDSDTVVAISDRIVIGSHRSQCGCFQFLPHKYDTLRIAKMLFGTLPSSLKSDSLKIHSLRDSNSIMVSRVFSIPKFGKFSSPFKSSDIYKCMVGSLSSDSDNQSNYSTIRSLEGIQDRDEGVSRPGRFPLISSRTFINPDPPEKFTRVRNSSLQLESNDVEDIMEELRAFSPNRLSRARRRQLSQIGMDDTLSIRLSNRSRLSSCSSVADGCGLSDSSAEWQQYGFAILFPNEFRSFIFQHILQLERELDRLIIEIHKAIKDKSQFFQSIYDGWTNTCVSLCLLSNSLRLKNPVWLSLASSKPDKKEAIATEFCDTLAYLIGRLNTKESHFFMSTLISAVLMNQLTWVASVAPPEKCSYDRSLLLGTSVIDPKQMRYNPAIAQLLELYYGIGAFNQGSSRFTKIVVIGENSRLIAQLLYVLSYFVRCSSVESRRNELLQSSLFGEEQALHDFGRSLLAGICTSYSPHFVLSGIHTMLNNFGDILFSICEDVRHPMGEPCSNSQLILSLSPSSSQALATSSELKNRRAAATYSQSTTMRQKEKDSGQKSSPVKLNTKPQLQEEQKNTLVLFINMSNHSVRIISAENCHVDDVPFVCPSEAVSSMLEEFAELYEYKCLPNFLLSFLEDRLGSLLTKSNVLVNLVTTTEEKEPLSMDRVSSVLNCNCSDLRLILNIAAVWAPGILQTAL